MPPLVRKWIADDDARIRAFAADGASLVRAAAALRRNKHSVYERVRTLGFPFPTLAAARKKWAGTPNNEWRD